MAWANVGPIGTATGSANGTTLVITTTAAVEAGNVIVVRFGGDNNATVDGDTTGVSVTDSNGNTYERAKESQETEGGSAADGAQAAIFFTQPLAAQLNSGSTITITHPSISDRCAEAREFTVTSGAVITIEGATEQGGTNVDPGDLTISGLANQEYLWLSAFAAEGEVDAYTEDADYTAMAATLISSTAGAPNANIMFNGGFRVFSGTTDTINTGWTPLTSLTWQQVYVALKEEVPPAAPGQDHWPRPPIRKFGQLHTRPKVFLPADLASVGGPEGQDIAPEAPRLMKFATKKALVHALMLHDLIQPGAVEEPGQDNEPPAPRRQFGQLHHRPPVFQPGDPSTFGGPGGEDTPIPPVVLSKFVDKKGHLVHVLLEVLDQPAAPPAEGQDNPPTKALQSPTPKGIRYRPLVVWVDGHVVAAPAAGNRNWRWLGLVISPWVP